METNVQILKKGNSLEFAVIPYKDYLQMQAKIMDYEDLLLLRNAKEIDKNNQGKTAKSLLQEIENI